MSVEIQTVKYDDLFFGRFSLIGLIDTEVGPKLRKVIVVDHLIKNSEQLVRTIDSNYSDFSWHAEYASLSKGDYKEKMKKFLRGDYSVLICSSSLLEGMRLPIDGTIIYQCCEHASIDRSHIAQISNVFQGENSKVIAISSDKNYTRILDRTLGLNNYEEEGL